MDGIWWQGADQADAGVTITAGSPGGWSALSVAPGSKGSYLIFHILEPGGRVIKKEDDHEAAPQLIGDVVAGDGHTPSERRASSHARSGC